MVSVSTFELQDVATTSNEDCKEAIKQRKQALSKFKKKTLQIPTT